MEAQYRNPITGERPSLKEVRRWIASHPLTDDDYGKGFVTPFGHRIAWRTVPMFGESDGWPAHVDGIAALGYLTESYDEYWRTELQTFRAEPGQIKEWIEDYSSYGDDEYDTENSTW